MMFILFKFLTLWCRRVCSKEMTVWRGVSELELKWAWMSTKIKKFWFFVRKTLTKLVSACKFSSWDHIHGRLDKRKIEAPKMLLSKAFWSTDFVFYHAFHECDLMMKLCKHLEHFSKSTINNYRFFFGFTVYRSWRGALVQQ